MNLIHMQHRWLVTTHQFYEDPPILLNLLVQYTFAALFVVLLLWLNVSLHHV